MGLNDTPSANRVHIGFFGRRNSGKSSMVNAVTGQRLSVVSEVLGTTTDPVSKSMELLPIGPVVIIDTPGMDDTGELGEKRVEKTKQILNRTDIAVVVMSVLSEPSEQELELLELLKKKQIPTILAMNKIDLAFEKDFENWASFAPQLQKLFVSAKEKTNIYELKQAIGKLASKEKVEKPLISDLVEVGDTVVLVTPIDSAAPKGRLILPQQQMVRDLLDAGALSVVVRETELAQALSQLKDTPKLVITDSQAFEMVSHIVPKDVMLTSFSIVFARYKGLLHDAVDGARAIDALEDGSRVLISEGCTHHRQCDDIGSVKLPKWLCRYTGKQLDISLSSGTEFPQNLKVYDLIIHCGGCMVNEREMRYRLAMAKEAGVAMTNYGTAIAYMNGILQRTLQPFAQGE